MNELKIKLRKYVRQIFPKKRVIKITKLQKEASIRDYYRIILSSNKTCIAMVLNSDQPSILANNIIEATEVFKSYKINVPSIYKFFQDDGILFIKDVGSTSLEKFKNTTGKHRFIPVYKQIIDALLKIHNSSLQKNIKLKKPFINSFTTDKFNQEFHFFLEHTKLIKSLPTSQINEIIQIFHFISKSLSQEKYVLTHRDLHARNIHLKENDIYFIDHQDARMGPLLYDIVSLIKDSYVNLPHEVETELISYYLEQSDSKWNNPLNHDKFFISYYLCLFQRSIKACGTFYYQSEYKNNLKYQQYIPTVLRYAQIALHKLGLKHTATTKIENLLRRLAN